MTLIVNTYSSIAAMNRKFNHWPNSMSDDQVMSWIYHGFLKQPPENVIEVKRSSLLSNCSPEIMKGLEELEKDALAGDLQKYLSRNAKKSGGKHDRLLYRSAIWHFHLVPQQGQAIHKSEHLIYGYFWRKTLYLLKYGTHARGEFYQDKDYLELINKEWPDVLPLDELEIEEPSLGGGVEPSGESSLMFNYYTNMKRYANHADIAIKSSESEVKEFLTAKGVVTGDTIYLDFIDYDREKKMDYYPSYAFYYQIRGTDLFILADLRNEKSEFKIISKKECTDGLSKIKKHRNRTVKKSIN